MKKISGFKSWLAWSVLLVVIGVELSLAAPARGATSCNYVADIGQACNNPLYICARNFDTSSSSPVGCVCRWGNFEFIRFPDYPSNICQFIDSLGADNSNAGFALIINFFVVLITVLVIISAVVSIVIGGYIYMTAGGSADRVRLAKGWIGSALLGIIIALGAWIILGAINPNLVNVFF